jgi:hypothetical protein
MISESFLPQEKKSQLCLTLRKNHEYTVKKGLPFSRPQPGCHRPNSPWQEYLNYSRPGRVWSVTSRLGTGKWQTFFYSVVKTLIALKWNGICAISVHSIFNVHREIWVSVEKSLQSKRSICFPVRKCYENVLASRAVVTPLGKGNGLSVV